MTSQTPSASGPTQNNFSGASNAGRDGYYGNDFRANTLNFYQTDEHLRLSQALSFDDMRRRKDMIAVAAPHSFDWIWDKECGFSEWLQSDESIFWITGKPGSGKSTLSKYLTENHQTRSHLGNNGPSWHILQFFYDFRSGTKTANTWEGLLKSLLTQINESSSKALEGLQVSGVGASQLLDTFCNVVQKQERQFCAFIDGLDETKESLWDSMKNIFQLTQRVKLKICVASRYFIEINTWLHDSRKIFVHEFNTVTIRQYLTWANQQALFRGRRPCSEKVLAIIVKRSSGVTLWAGLALEMALKELNTGVSEDSVIEQLCKLPTEMHDMYHDHLMNIPSQLQPEAALYLYLIHLTRLNIQPEELFSLMKTASSKSPLVLLPHDLSYDEFNIRLSAVLGGLASISRRTIQLPSRSIHEDRIELMHETLNQFLQTNKWPEARIWEGLAADSGYVEGSETPLEHIFGKYVELCTTTTFLKKETKRWRFSNEEIWETYPMHVCSSKSLAILVQSSFGGHRPGTGNLPKSTKPESGHMVVKNTEPLRTKDEGSLSLPAPVKAMHPPILVEEKLVFSNQSSVYLVYPWGLSPLSALSSHRSALIGPTGPLIAPDLELIEFPAPPSLLKDAILSSIDCAEILAALQRYYLPYRQNLQFKSTPKVLIDPDFMAPGHESMISIAYLPSGSPPKGWSLLWDGKSGSTEHISCLRTCELVFRHYESSGEREQWKIWYGTDSSTLEIKYVS